VSETLVVKHNTHEILEFESVSIWIFYKNLLLTLVSVVFA
jgi:hypothetical protein